MLRKILDSRGQGYRSENIARGAGLGIGLSHRHSFFQYFFHGGWGTSSREYSPASGVKHAGLRMGLSFQNKIRFFTGNQWSDPRVGSEGSTVKTRGSSRRSASHGSGRPGQEAFKFYGSGRVGSGRVGSGGVTLRPDPRGKRSDR